MKCDNCDQEADVTVKIDGVGIKLLCRKCFVRECIWEAAEGSVLADTVESVMRIGEIR